MECSLLALLTISYHSVTSALDDGLYSIMNEYTNMYIDCAPNPLSQTASVTSFAQVLSISDLNDPYDANPQYQVKCENNNKCWDYNGDNGCIGRQGCSKTNVDQKYMFISRTGHENSYEIKIGPNYLDITTGCVEKVSTAKYFMVIPFINFTSYASTQPSITSTIDTTSSRTNVTMLPSEHRTKTHLDITDTTLILAAVSLICACIAVIIVVFIARHNNKKNTQAMHSELSLPLLKKSLVELFDEEKELAIPVQNAMVILIAIGEYDANPTDPDQELAQDLNNLDMVDKDIRNLHQLFGPNHLNYAIYPEYDLNAKIKLHWTQNEIITLLKEKATVLETKLEYFDALIVVISGHGLSGNICTSDCKLMEKLAIHRLFSQTRPRLRDLPRIFMFDCCDGQWDCGKGTKPTRNKDRDQGKIYSLIDIDDETEKAWKKNEENPDHRLVEIHAANAGFQSKLNREKGSYMLSEFTERMISNLNNERNEYIFKIFDDIQQELANKKKQQIDAKYNDRTRYIKFLPKQVENINVENI